MNTKLFIRPNTDIRILDTEYTELALVGLRVDNINNYEVQVGDILSIRFDNPTLTPDYVGDWEVVAISPTYSCCLTDPLNTIVVALPWGESTGLNPGWARNIVRAADGGLLSSAGYGFQGSGFNGTSPYMQSIGELSDGTLIIGGVFTTYNGVSANRIVGINPDGTINATFSYGTGFSGGGQAVVNVEVDSQDRIYVGGGYTTYNGTTVSCLVRLTATGSVDPTFNVGTGLLGGTPFAYSIELDEANGRIYIGGQFTTYNGTSANRIVCLLEDGSIDTSFNYGTGFSAAFGTRRLRLGPDDKLYCVGGFTSYNGTSINRICRLNTDGTLDTSFVVGTGFNAEAFDIMFYGGKIYVIGTFTSYDGVSANRIIRLNNDGSRDTLFDIGTGLDNTAYGIINHQGFLYAYGLFTSYNGQAANKIAVIDYFGNLNINYQGQFNSGSFVFVIYPLDNSLLIGGSFTSYNGQTVNRISIFKSLLRSIRYEVKELNLKEDLQFPLTYNIIDIKEPQNRKSDYSKSITLPGTKNNNRILAQLFEIGADSTYNTNLKKDVFVTQDGLEIFNGYIKIENINRENWNDISYDVKISGKLVDIFSKLFTSDKKDLKLSDLDYSEWEHDRNRDSIIGSWDGVIQKNGVTYSNYTIGPSYSVADTVFATGNFTGFDIGTHSLQIGDVVYFQMDNPGDVTVNFNQSQGHHTVIAVTATYAVANLEFRAGATNTGVLTKWSSSGEGYVYPTIDFGNQLATDWASSQYIPNLYAKTLVDKIFSTIGFQYDSEFFGSEFFKRLVVLGKAKSQVNMIWSLDSDNLYKTNPIRTKSFATLTNVQFDIESYWNDPDGSFSQDQDINIIWTQYDSNNQVVGTPTTTLIFDGACSFGNLPPGTIGFTILGLSSNTYLMQVVNQSPSFTMNPGDYVTVEYTRLFSNSSPIITNTNVRAYNLTPDDFNIVDYVSDMTCKDFLTSLISMFNLYVEPDKNNDRTLIIEPFNDYYRLDSDAKDWTLKVDLSKDYEITPISPNISRNNQYTYTDDGDYFNKDFKDQQQIVYGYYETTQETDFNNTTQVTKVGFAQTPLVDRTNDTSRVIVPTIVKDASLNKIEQFKPRIFYWTGLRYVTRFTLNGVSTEDVYNLPMYGYAGHFDNPENATLDLNFNIMPKYYYGQDYLFKVTANTLFKRYYENYYNEITSPSTKLLKCYMKLNSYDISNLSFRRLYYIYNNLYRLQSINDYDPLLNDSVKCEFIKVKEAPSNGILPPLEQVEVTTGGLLPTVGRFNSIAVGRNITVGDISDTGIIIGEDSRAEFGATNYLINGSDITIGTSSRNVSAFGSGLRIGATTSNVFIFGASSSISDGVENTYIFGNGITATQSNAVYFDSTFTFSGIPGLGSFPDLEQVLNEGNQVGNIVFDLGNDSIILGLNTNTVNNSANSFISGDNNIIDTSQINFVFGQAHNIQNNSVFNCVFGQSSTAYELNNSDHNFFLSGVKGALDSDDNFAWGLGPVFINNASHNFLLSTGVPNGSLSIGTSSGTFVFGTGVSIENANNNMFLNLNSYTNSTPTSGIIYSSPVEYYYPTIGTISSVATNLTVTMLGNPMGGQIKLAATGGVVTGGQLLFQLDWSTPFTTYACTVTQLADPGMSNSWPLNYSIVRGNGSQTFFYSSGAGNIASGDVVILTYVNAPY